MPIYMKIETADGKVIEGESKDDAHKGWIDLLSLDMGVTNDGTFAAGGGGGRGRSHLNDLSVMTLEGKSSPALFQMCCDGKHLKSVTVDFTKSGGEQEVYMTWTLTNALISSYHVSGTGEDVPRDNIGFNFEAIKYTYKEQDEKGKVKVAGEASWNQGTNKPQ